MDYDTGHDNKMFNFMSDLVCNICPRVINIGMRSLWTWLLEILCSVNEGIEFSPVLACWLVIIAAFNWRFPRLLPGYFNWTKLNDYLAVMIRLLAIWVAFSGVWVPANRFLFWVMRDFLLLPRAVCRQWLPFLSMAAAVLLLTVSIKESVKSSTKQPSRRRHLTLDVSVTPTNGEHRIPPSLLRQTRSGVVYGKWDI